MNSVLVSVIVPIYNVEKYLDRCVESIVKQTYSNLEIILVDDGSLDNCSKMCDEWLQRDSRIKVIHKQNGGLGPARNTGIKASTGDYIGFVDSDDWIKPKMYESLMEVAIQENADIVVSGHCDVTGGKTTAIKVHPLAGKTFRSCRDISEIRKKLYGHSVNDKEVEAFPMSVCMSVYRKTLIEEGELLFQEILSEDTIFNLTAYKYAHVISFTGNTNYCYRKEEQVSITQTFSVKKQLRFEEYLNTLRQMANQEEDEDCIIRTKRTAIDCCRLYVGIVDNSKIPIKMKKKYIQTFAKTEKISECWEGYPIDKLPIQQRLFHMMIMNEWYGVALALNRLRQWAKKGIRK